MSRPLVVSLLVGLGVFGACGGDEPAPAPVVGLIDAAVAEVEAHYGAPQEYFEISATLDQVSVIVAVADGTAAEQGYLGADGGFTAPEPVGPASGATFRAEAVTFDPDRIFDGLRDELDDPVIVDFAIQGGAGGTVIYDVSVASEAGGVLLVLLSPSGEILGAQGQ